MPRSGRSRMRVRPPSLAPTEPPGIPAQRRAPSPSGACRSPPPRGPCCARPAPDLPRPVLPVSALPVSGVPCARCICAPERWRAARPADRSCSVRPSGGVDTPGGIFIGDSDPTRGVPPCALPRPVVPVAGPPGPAAASMSPRCAPASPPPSGAPATARPFRRRRSATCCVGCSRAEPDRRTRGPRPVAAPAGREARDRPGPRRPAAAAEVRARVRNGCDPRRTEVVGR